MSPRSTIGALGLGIAAALTLAAPAIAPNAPDALVGHPFAPPMRLHIRDAAGWHAPFVYRQVADDVAARRFHDDRTMRVPLRTGGRTSAAEPVLLLGGDPMGRDLFSRLLYGARLSLGVTFVGACGALLLGAILGGIAGASGRIADGAVMLLADFMLALPGVYLILVLRSLLPLVLSVSQVFSLMAGFFAFAAWPHVARGVRAIVATERTREYAEAARAVGAGPFHVLFRHLLPATRGFLTVELVLLVPALLVAEATISFLGLGFPPPASSWGTMLQDASNVTNIDWAPWLLAPGAALFFVVLCVQLAAGGRAAARATLYGGFQGPAATMRE